MEKSQIFLPVSEAYDRWSAFYDAYDNPMVFMASRIIDQTMPAIAGQSIFEFGCGTGRNLAAFATGGAGSVAGCDLSEGMLNVAKARLPGAALFRHDMGQPVPLPDGAFDRTLFSLTLEHLPDLVPPLREARRITRPDGIIQLIEIHPYYSLTGVAAHFDDDATEVRMPTFPHQFETYLNAFAGLGFHVESCREWKPDNVGNPAPLQRLKRGPGTPMTVEFLLRASFPG